MSLQRFKSKEQPRVPAGEMARDPLTVAQLHTMTIEERLLRASALEIEMQTEKHLPEEYAPFTGFERAWISMLRDTQGYPYLFRLELHDGNKREM